MKKRLLLAFIVAAWTAVVQAYNMNRASVHDPSVVWDPSSKSFYVFGSHKAMAKSDQLISWNQPAGFTWRWSTASSSNATNADAFKQQQVTKVKKGGTMIDFPNFDAHAWSAAIPKNGDAVWGSIDGNLWAPDVIYNRSMKKWCMYMSINGVQFNSSIVLLTSDHIEGPYRYQAPVVISGFNVTNTSGVNFKKTDLEMVIGTQSSLPSRYARGKSWGTYLPHCIDPCVFYDEQGKLWLSYGSWSNGIWMLELDEETGLRDYDVEYGDDSNRGYRQSKDPYYGKKIAGGAYSSGEGSYIRYVGGYYFLFVTYGGLDSVGGYQMRVFRSTNPDGPFTDAAGQSAIYSDNTMNYGPKDTAHRGINIFGAYGSWGNMSVAELSQGHNSVINAEDGRTYLVYHTRFKNSGEGHQVRVHQLFQNKNGWLVAAPFEYTGETVKNADIAATQQVSTDRIPGSYQLLVHRYGLDYTKQEIATPVKVQLSADGKISGSLMGTWTIEPGTSYITVKLGTAEYKGVMVEQMLEPSNTTTVAFTALSTSGTTVWGYREKSLPDAPANADIGTGIKAYYNFDSTTITNQEDKTQTAVLQKEGNNSMPTIVTNGYSGKGLHTNFGAAGNTSNVKFKNPLYGNNLPEGMTIAFWVNVIDENLWDALFSFYNPQTTARIYMTPNAYVGFNDMAGKWIDLNHPSNVTTNYLSFGSWSHVVMTVSRTAGLCIYVDGELKAIQATNSDGFNGDYNLIVDHISKATDMYMGFGSFWGSLNASYDELLVYDRVLTADDVMGLYVKSVTNGNFASGLQPVVIQPESDGRIYNLNGQLVGGTPCKGIYIVGGKKQVIR